MSTQAMDAPTRSYDIGIGRCTGIDAPLVSVVLDSAMVRRLAPGEPWRCFGSCLLRLTVAQCSTRRPPAIGDEVYLDSAMLDSIGCAALDVGNTGTCVDVDLRALILDTHPAIDPPLPAATQRADAAARPKPWLAVPPPQARKRGRPRSR